MNSLKFLVVAIAIIVSALGIYSCAKENSAELSKANELSPNTFSEVHEGNCPLNCSHDCGQPS